MIRVSWMLILLGVLLLAGPLDFLEAEQLTAPLSATTRLPDPSAYQVDIPGPDDLYDIKGPVPIPDSGRTILITVLTLLTAVLLAALLYFLWKRARKQRAVLAHETALLKLSEAQKLIDAHEVDSFVTLIDQTLRSYIEERFAITAQRKTSREFISGLTTGKRSVPELLTEHSENLQTWLAHCDMVKFARGTLTTDTMHKMLANLHTFINATRMEDEK